MTDQQYLEMCEKLDLFFKEALEEAINNQHVQLSSEAVFYLLRIITRGSIDDPTGNSVALGPSYLEAHHVENSQVAFKRIGDLSLMIAGIWWQHLLRRLIDVDYYIQLGSSSYQKASETSSPNLAELFQELSKKFSTMADVLSETMVFIPDAKMSDMDILRMYEVWLRTRNPFFEKKLITLKIIPIPGSTTKQ